MTAILKSAPKRHYNKPPITEAVIDLRVALPPGLSVEKLAQVQKGQEKTYPTSEQIFENLGEMMFTPQSSSASAKRSQIGFLFRSADGKQLYQARSQGFSMSRLAPYADWDEFRDEARRLWNLYRDVAQPTKVERIGVRYLNRIDLPLPVRDFDEYLRTAPLVSPDLPQELTGFFMQLTLPVEMHKSFAIINQTILDPGPANVLPLILDIDIFRTADLPTSEEDMWLFIDQLRDVKNDVFEGCITDKARELFK